MARSDRRKKPFPSWIAAAGVAWIWSLVAAPDAWAHRVYVYAWIEGEMVHTESYFGSKRKVQEGLIQVYDTAGEKVLDGRTDREGRFSFKNPGRGTIRIVVEAGTGHRGEYVLSQGEVSGGVSADLSSAKTPESSGGSPSMPVDMTEIRKVFEEALDARLKPIQRELVEVRKEKGPGFTEVVGGLGFIFGVVGVILYLRSRKGR